MSWPGCKFIHSSCATCQIKRRCIRSSGCSVFNGACLGVSTWRNDGLNILQGSWCRDMLAADQMWQSTAGHASRWLTLAALHFHRRGPALRTDCAMMDAHTLLKLNASHGSLSRRRIILAVCLSMGVSQPTYAWPSISVSKCCHTTS